MTEEFENYGIDDIIENDEKGLYNETYDGEAILTNQLTDNISDKATEIGVNLKNLGNEISIDNLKLLVSGNLKSLSGDALGMASKIGLSSDMLEKLKNKPTAIMDSMLTEAQDKFGSLKNPQQLLSNISGNLPIDFKSMMSGDAFKNALSGAGIGKEILDKVDMSKVTSVDDIKSQLSNVMPKELSNVDLDGVLEKATGGMDNMVKNFGMNQIKSVALSEISDKVPTNILKRFL